MRLRRLWVTNFRGIRSLDWKLPPDRRLITLLGPGDSGKSTILEAIHYLLGDRWSVPFSDTDFHRVNVGEPVLIKALLVDVPASLKKETAFGLWLSGVDHDGEPQQDPADGLEPALLVELAVDASLEPQWSVVRVEGDKRNLTAAQRRAFSTFKVDDRTDAQLRWSRNSPLGRMSSQGGGEREALANASRAAREALADHDSSPLADLAAKVQTKTNKIGSGSFSDIKPGLDTSRSSMGAALALYEDVVPLTGYGLGSRRLASLAVQQLAAGSRSVAVIDELESGLEPHRAVRLLKYLVDDEDYAQVFVTTHSPVIVEAAEIENLATVQATDGVVTVISLGDADVVIQRLRRMRPSSLLARRVIVAEGKTEHGLLLECLDAWDTERAQTGLSTAAGEGVALQDGGGGHEVGPRAAALAQLGLVVAGFLDNDDRTVDGAVADAEAAGVQMIRWDRDHSTETQIVSGLTEPGLNSFIALGVELRSGEDTVRHDLAEVEPRRAELSLDVSDWLRAGMTLDDARSRIGAAAMKRKWFKDVEGGRALGRWIITNRRNLQLASTIARLQKVQAFVYPEDTSSTAAEGDNG